MEKTKIANFIKKNKTEVFAITAILTLALFFRLYKISEYLTFLGDEGRDVRVIRDLITKGNLVFVGPQTSIGNMYLGPLYYYLVAPFLLIFRLSPVGPAIGNAIIGTITVFLSWLVGRQWFGKLAGTLTAFFFAISPVAIIYSRSSWNPNPAPLFSLICAYGIYRVWRYKQNKWIIAVSVSLAFALQMHYLSLLLIPFLGIYWLLSLINQQSKDRKQLIRLSLYGFLSFCLLMSPLLLFDIKHNFMNFNAFKTFFTDRQTTINLNPSKSDRFIPVMNTIVYDLYLGRQYQSNYFLFILLFLIIVFNLIFTKNKKAIWLTTSWVIIAILGLGVYKQHIYIHYLGFIYPAIYLLVGLFLSKLVKNKNLLLKILGFLLTLYLTYLNIFYTPIKQQPNRQLQTTIEAVDLIIKESEGKPFNFGLIAKQNYDESYRYFFENKKSKMVRGEDQITDQLFVICEDGDLCQPEGNPAYQIAIFGPAKVVNNWSLNNLKIYKLEKSL